MHQQPEVNGQTGLSAPRGAGLRDSQAAKQERIWLGVQPCVVGHVSGQWGRLWGARSLTVTADNVEPEACSGGDAEGLDGDLTPQLDRGMQGQPGGGHSGALTWGTHCHRENAPQKGSGSCD